MHIYQKVLSENICIFTFIIFPPNSHVHSYKLNHTSFPDYSKYLNIIKDILD